MRFITPRLLNFSGLIICAFLLTTAYCFQILDGMQPCLLCLLQRAIFILLGLLFFLAILQNPQRLGRALYAVLINLIAIGGVIVAARQTWLQHQPPQADTVCLPGLDYLIQTRPLPEVLQIMFHGGRDCAVILWRFWGLSMAEWSLIFFVALGLLALAQVFLLKDTQNNITLK